MEESKSLEESLTLKDDVLRIDGKRVIWVEDLIFFINSEISKAKKGVIEDILKLEDVDVNQEGDMEKKGYVLINAIKSLEIESELSKLTTK